MALSNLDIKFDASQVLDLISQPIETSCLSQAEEDGGQQRNECRGRGLRRRTREEALRIGGHGGGRGMIQEALGGMIDGFELMRRLESQSQLRCLCICHICYAVNLKVRSCLY